MVPSPHPGRIPPVRKISPLNKFPGNFANILIWICLPLCKSRFRKFLLILHICNRIARDWQIVRKVSEGQISVLTSFHDILQITRLGDIGGSQHWGCDISRKLNALQCGHPQGCNHQCYKPPISQPQMLLWGHKLDISQFEYDSFSV